MSENKNNNKNLTLYSFFNKKIKLSNNEESNINETQSQVTHEVS